MLILLILLLLIHVAGKLQNVDTKSDYVCYHNVIGNTNQFYINIITSIYKHMYINIIRLDEKINQCDPQVGPSLSTDVRTSSVASHT